MGGTESLKNGCSLKYFSIISFLSFKNSSNPGNGSEKGKGV